MDTLLNAPDCSYDRGDRILGWDRLRGIAERCTHVAFSAGPNANAIPVQVLLYCDRPCLRRDHVLGKTCEKEGTDRIWVVCRSKPVSRRRPTDPIRVEAQLSALNEDLLLLSLNPADKARASVTLPPMHVYPVYEHKGVQEAPRQRRHLDDCPVCFSPECQDEIRFAKCTLHATLWVAATRFVDQPVTTEIEVTIPPKHGVNIATIVEVDLVGYSTIARSLEESLNAEAVYALNRSIQGLIDSALDKVGVSRANALVADTGDGAILTIGNPETAHQFAVLLHHRSEEHNKPVKEPLSKRVFRVGIATGRVVSRISAEGTRAFGGVTIANAVRLESGSSPGDITVDEATFLAFPAEVQRLYTEVRVTGKRNETYRAFRYCPIPSEEAGLVGPGPIAPTPTKPADRRKTLEMIRNLYPEAQLDRLMYLQEIPIDYQPSSKLTYAERCNAVLAWAESPRGKGLEQLAADISYLMKL